jgi:hypothetical protein
VESRHRGNQRAGIPRIVVVCLLGLLLTLSFMFRHPDVGELIQQYNLF